MKTPPSKNAVKAPIILACGNAFAAPQAGDDGLLPATLTIPYGQWPHGPREHNVNGRKMRLVIAQTFDQEGAVAIANALATKRAKSQPGIPVYQGHPDAPEFAADHPDKSAIGWITGAVANAAGMEITVDWVKNPGRGFAFFSPYWHGPSAVEALPSGDAPGRATMRVASMRSLGLVNEPNIEDFRLPNAAADEPTTTPKKETIMEQVLQELGLANSATEGEAVAKVKALKADLAAANGKATTAETALSAANKRHNDHLIADALANGQINGAEKPQWEARLANAFDTEAPLLAALPKKDIKTAPVTTGDKRVDVSGTMEQIIALCNAKQKELGCDHATAWSMAMKEKPELFAPPKQKA